MPMCLCRSYSHLHILDMCLGRVHHGYTIGRDFPHCTCKHLSVMMQVQYLQVMGTVFTVNHYGLLYLKITINFNFKSNYNVYKHIY